MKKGFTLIEIIISIGLILIIGVSTSIIMINVNNNKKIEEIIKEILDAGNAYIKVETDDSGNIYVNEIVRGAKGVQIPLSNLVNAGYVNEENAR